MKTIHPSRAPHSVPPGGPLLELRNVAISYGGIAAIRGISLCIHAGEIVAFIGANGAGKTTTLKSIVGLLPLAAGEILFAGRQISGRSTREIVSLGISLVPEGRGIFPNLTVRENLELGGYSHRHMPTIRESIAEVIALFPRLGDRMTQAGGTLSGGEQQMLAIGRAIVARPTLLLLDEPSLGIAPLLVRDIFEAIAQIARSGTTILLVEQNTRLALSYCARAYVLQTGLITKAGPAVALAADPEISAAYLGE